MYNANFVVGKSIFTYIREKWFLLLKMRYAARCAVNFYSAGVVTCNRRIGSWVRSWDFWSQSYDSELYRRSCKI
jgi:hypothetical protein